MINIVIDWGVKGAALYLNNVALSKLHMTMVVARIFEVEIHCSLYLLVLSVSKCHTDVLILTHYTYVDVPRRCPFCV